MRSFFYNRGQLGRSMDLLLRQSGIVGPFIEVFKTRDAIGGGGRTQADKGYDFLIAENVCSGCGIHTASSL